MKLPFSSKIVAYALVASTSIFLFSCSSGYKPQNNKTEVTIHELSDAQMLNPVNFTDATAGYICNNLFQTLTGIDFKTLKIVPILAKSLPTVEKMDDGKGLLITYEIRPEAKWDNGTPITAKDVEFSLKLMKCPNIKNENKKPYFEFISDIKFYDDPKKFTLVCNEVYILAEPSSGDFAIIPSYIYDTKNILQNYTIKQINEEKEKLASDPKILEFANEFNSEKYMRESAYIVGSGAYKLTEWKTGQRIVLEKKKNWWGDTLKNINTSFEANADKLIYQTVNDQTAAIVSLKAGNLDVMYSIKAKDFVELPKSEKFTQNFNTYTPTMFAYTYLGLNTKNPKFRDKKVRQALAHLVDVDKMIETINYGLAERVIGPVHPTKKESYNSSIVPFDYNVEKTKTMLAEAGWKDTNGDGTIDKVIDGQKTEFTIDFIVNAGNDARKQAALLFQEEARKVGIKVNVTQQEWSIYVNNTKKHNFELFFGAWIGSPLPNDHKQIYHTESSRNEGSNYVSFGNAQSDALIDSMRTELDETKRNAMEKRFQAMLYDDAACIFLWAPKERIAIHKRFTNADPSIYKPGFWEAGFKTQMAN